MKRLLFFLSLLFAATSSRMMAQTSLTAMDIYECLGRKFDDPAVQRVVARLGKDSTYAKHGFKTSHRFSSGVEIHALDDIYGILIEVDTYYGRLPFGITKATPKDYFQRELGATLYPDQRSCSNYTTGFRAEFHGNGTPRALIFLEPNYFCATRQLHYAAC